MPFLALIAWPLLAVSATALALWLLIAFRVARAGRGRPTIRAGLDLPPPPTPPPARTGAPRTGWAAPAAPASPGGAPPPPSPVAGREGDSAAGWPRVSIIVPAHNEEDMIDACVISLRRQRYDDLEIIFALDRCTDRTAEILRVHAAEDARITLVEIDECPEGWAGKCNAARLGAERATGAHLVFADADTRFDPDLVRAAVALAADRDLALLSLLSTLTYGHRFERVVQPVASMNLIRLYPIERVNRAARTRPFANGQFMLFRRDWYERIGGHAAVKDDFMEDIAIARVIDAAGGRCAIVLAEGMLICAMYDSLEALEIGWRRIFIGACKHRPKALRSNATRVVTTGIVFPALQLVAIAVGVTLAAGPDPALGVMLAAAAAAGLLVQTLTLVRTYRMAGAPLGAIVFYPLGCRVVARILRAGARDLDERRPIRWAGKEYLVEARY